jgi:hypothetical protein
LDNESMDAVFYCASGKKAEQCATYRLSSVSLPFDGEGLREG